MGFIDDGLGRGVVEGVNMELKITLRWLGIMSMTVYCSGRKEYPIRRIAV